MEHRVRFQLVVSADTVVEAPSSKLAWAALAGRMQEIVNREYEDQRCGLEPDGVDEGLFYGLALRLPGDMIVTGLDLAEEKRIDDDLQPPTEGRGPKLRVIQGGLFDKG